MNKHATFLVAASLLLLAGAGCTTTGTTNQSATTPATGTTAQGRAVFSITDAAPSISGVTAVVVTVDKVEVHSATADWVSVSTATQKYDLFTLKTKSVAELLADVKLDVGTYDQIRLNISKVDVTANGKTETAKLPSSVLKIVGNLTIAANQTSTVLVDFDLDKSLHVTGSGAFILAPVVQLQVKNGASVTIKSDNSVEMTGGKVETEQAEGVDEKGETKVDFQLPEKLDLDADGEIKLHVED